MHCSLDSCAFWSILPARLRTCEWPMKPSALGHRRRSKATSTPIRYWRRRCRRERRLFTLGEKRTPQKKGGGTDRDAQTDTEIVHSSPNAPFWGDPSTHPRFVLYVARQTESRGRCWSLSYRTDGKREKALQASNTLIGARRISHNTTPAGTTTKNKSGRYP